MKPVRALANTLSTLLAADAAYLAHATLAIKVKLITAPFTPSLDRVAADLSIAAGGGLDPILGSTGAQLESVDPVTAELIVEIKAPAGGFRWETTGVPSPVINVYGFALTTNAGVLLGMHKLDAAIALTDVNQSITAPPLVFRIDPNKVS